MVDLRWSRVAFRCAFPPSLSPYPCSTPLLPGAFTRPFVFRALSNPVGVEYEEKPEGRDYEL